MSAANHLVALAFGILSVPEWRRRQHAIDEAVRRGFAAFDMKPAIPLEKCGCERCQAQWTNLYGYIAATIRAEFRRIMAGET